MIEHERAYVFTHEGIKKFLQDHPVSNGSTIDTCEWERITDSYLSDSLRIRTYEATDQYFLTKKTGDKSRGYRFQNEEAISKEVADILIASADLVVKKDRRHILTDGRYTITVDLLESPMKIAILEIEALDEVLYPIPVDVTHRFFDVELTECPLNTYSLLRRKIGICGAASSGKTETAKILSHTLNTSFRSNSFHVIEFAHTFIQKYRRLPQFADHFFIWYGQFSRENDAGDANIVISDCPTFLTYIYIMHYQNVDFGPESALYMSKIYKRVLFDLQSYTDIIFLELQDYVENNIRYQSQDEAKEIEDRIRRFLSDHKVPHKNATYRDHKKILNELFFINQ